MTYCFVIVALSVLIYRHFCYFCLRYEALIITSWYICDFKLISVVGLIPHILRKNLTKRISQDVFYHIFFWMGLLCLMMLANVPAIGFFDALTTNLITIIFYLAITYIDYFYLFPKYLKERKLWIHFTWVGLYSLLLTPIKMAVLHLATWNSEEPLIQDASHMFFMFLSLFFVGVCSSIYRIMNEWIIQQRDKKELEKQTLQSELNFLKSQINPHFLFNTLNSLYALTLKKSDLAPEIVLKLSEMMRYMLYECNEKTVFLSKEIQYIQNYLDLEKLRHGAKMDVHFDVLGDTENKKIAPLLLMPFIENSFKHGINSQVSEGYVNIELYVQSDDLCIKVENSKSPSVPRISEKKSGGIGLINVKRRLHILYPELHKLEIMETPISYQIELNLSLTYY